MNDTQDAWNIEDKLRGQSSVPHTLAIGFEAFEVIRAAARAHEIRAPGLFAAFMTTADAAVTGRDALISAPSLPAIRSARRAGAIGPDTPLDEVTSAVARMAALLRERLAEASALAQAPADRDACEQAAEAARRICQLMGDGNDDGRLR